MVATAASSVPDSTDLSIRVSPLEPRSQNRLVGRPIPSAAPSATRNSSPRCMSYSANFSDEDPWFRQRTLQAESIYKNQAPGNLAFTPSAKGEPPACPHHVRG